MDPAPGQHSAVVEFPLPATGYYKSVARPPAGSLSQPRSLSWEELTPYTKIGIQPPHVRFHERRHPPEVRNVDGRRPAEAAPLSTASAERHSRMTVRIRATEQRGHLIFFLLYFLLSYNFFISSIILLILSFCISTSCKFRAL